MTINKLFKILLVLTLIFLFNNDAFSQSLSPERVAKIKDCTVRISVDGGNSVGTGFTINSAGQIVTCWHVIQSALILDPQGKIIGARGITVKYNNGDTYKYGIPLVFLKKSLDLLIQHDICLIIPNEKLKNESQFLKIGNFNALNEGQEVVTCGYPFGMMKQFISKGIISSKSTDTGSYRGINAITKFSNNSALIDITMNKGNSGGAIIKLGATVDDDEVVGVADFIITPVGKDITDLLGELQKSNNSGGSVYIEGINPNDSMAKITQVLTSLSDGISGCVSIEYLQTLIASTK